MSYEYREITGDTIQCGRYIPYLDDLMNDKWLDAVDEKSTEALTYVPTDNENKKFHPAKWMDEFPDMNLNNVVLPSTHNTLTSYPLIDLICETSTWLSWIPNMFSTSPLVTTWETTQRRTLSEQLNDGIRVFDLRFTKYNGKFYGTHGDSRIGYFIHDITLDFVLGEICNFLCNNQTECIVLRVRVENSDRNETHKFFSIIIERLLRMIYKPRYLIPILSELSGKVIIHSHDGFEDDLVNKDGSKISDYVYQRSFIQAGNVWINITAQSVPDIISKHNEIYGGKVENPLALTISHISAVGFSSGNIQAGFWSYFNSKDYGTVGDTVKDVASWVVPAISDVMMQDALEVSRHGNWDAARIKPISLSTGYNIVNCDYYDGTMYIRNCIEMNRLKRGNRHSQ